MIFNRTFGVPAEYQATYTAASDELDACVAKHLLQEPYMSDMSRSAIAHTHAHLRSLVTLKERPEGNEIDEVDSDLKPDLEPWEQHASVERIENRNPTNALEDIDILDDSFLGLAAKLPRWLPPLRKAYEARDRLHQGLVSFFDALDLEAEGHISDSYKDLSDVSELIRSYDMIWKRIGLSVHARAAAGLSMPWA